MMDKWHVLPVDDEKEHEESVYCECVPTVKFHENGTLIVHNAYDNRELLEVDRLNDN